MRLQNSSRKTHIYGHFLHNGFTVYIWKMTFSNDRLKMTGWFHSFMLYDLMGEIAQKMSNCVSKCHSFFEQWSGGWISHDLSKRTWTIQQISQPTRCSLVLISTLMIEGNPCLLTCAMEDIYWLNLLAWEPMISGPSLYIVAHWVVPLVLLSEMLTEWSLVSANQRSVSDSFFPLPYIQPLHSHHLPDLATLPKCLNTITNPNPPAFRKTLHWGYQSLLDMKTLLQPLTSSSYIHNQTNFPFGLNPLAIQQTEQHHLHTALVLTTTIPFRPHSHPPHVPHTSRTASFIDKKEYIQQPWCDTRRVLHTCFPLLTRIT